MAGTAEQAIRVTARGEFGQLQRGLKNLQGDLKNVLGEIDKGARKGGIFDDSNLRALDVFRRRFKDTLGDLNREYGKQKEVIDDLYKKMAKMYAFEREEIQKQISERERELKVIKDQIQAVEQLYRKRDKEASSYTSEGGSGGSGMDKGFALTAAGKMFGRMGSMVGTVGKFALGLAGAGSLLGMAQEAYQLAHQREVNSLDLAQRMRGYGFGGSNSSMYDQVSAIGRRDNMGYSQMESWGLQDSYTSQAGALGAGGQYALQKFARGYGLDASEVGGLVGGVKQLGGVAQPKAFADMIASSVSQSGMLPRIKEVMETHTGLLQNLNTSFKDGASEQILAYQTTLDKLGNENGMTRLTGQQGANIIGGLGGIFSPGNDKWKWTGVAALQNYDPSKYRGMGLYGLESSFEEGIGNPDNIPAMAQYLRKQSGGNNEVFKRLMQAWLQEGGFNATKKQVTELDQVTNGFTAFDKDKIASVLGGDSGAKYDNERQGEFGQTIMAVEAQFNKDLEALGSKFLPEIITMKQDISSILQDIEGGDVGETVKDILKFLKDSGLGLIAAMLIAPKLGKKALDVWNSRNKSTGLPGEEMTEEQQRGSASTRYGSGVESPAESELGTSSFAKQMEGKYPRQPGETFSDWIERVRWEEGKAQGAKISPEGWEERFDAPPEGVKSGGFFKGLKGFGSGLANALGFIPAGLGALQADKDLRSEHSDDPNYNPSTGEVLKRMIMDMFGVSETDMYNALPASQRGNSSIGNPLEDAKTSVQDFSKNGVDSLLGFNTEGTATLVDLKDGGSEALATLQDQGLVSIRGIQKDGTALITALSTKGSEALNDLDAKGLIHYSSVEKITSTKLDEIKGIHQDFVDKFLLLGLMGSGMGEATPLSSLEGSSGGFFGSLFGGAKNLFNYGGTSFFKGWRNRVTSPFGDPRGNGRYHQGLDIDGSQGDRLQALAGGNVSFLYMDDGGQYDDDGVANTRMGGTELGIKMSDGSTYFYSHMSQVNPALLKAWQSGNHNISVNSGDYLGNLGGDVGVPGSGYSTTGSHLHLGYMDSNGNLINPEGLLNSTDMGNSSIGNAASVGTANQSHITVDVNIQGTGASQLNGMTIAQLKSLVQQIFTENKRQELSMNPTLAGRW